MALTFGLTLLVAIRVVAALACGAVVLVVAAEILHRREGP